MLPRDKEIMYMHLDAIRKAIQSLNDENDQSWDWRLNCNLIDIRDKIRERVHLDPTRKTMESYNGAEKTEHD